MIISFSFFFRSIVKDDNKNIDVYVVICYEQKKMTFERKLLGYKIAEQIYLSRTCLVELSYGFRFTAGEFTIWLLQNCFHFKLAKRQSSWLHHSILLSIFPLVSIPSRRKKWRWTEKTIRKQNPRMEKLF